MSGAGLQQEAEGYRLEVALEFAVGGSTRLIEERAVGLSRDTHWDVRFESGTLGDSPKASPTALFRQDLDCFLARIEGEGGAYVSDERILHVLSLVEAIEALS